MTPEDVETFRRCIAVGGRGAVPSDTVYGLATEPDSKEGVTRLYALKGRAAAQPAAVMFFDLDLALAALPELGERTRAALVALLPGALTLLLPTRAGATRWPAAPSPAARPARARPGRALAPLAAARWPVLQSSANRSGGADAPAARGRARSDPGRAWTS